MYALRLIVRSLRQMFKLEMYIKDQCHWVKTIYHERKSLIRRNVHIKFKSSTFKWLKTYICMIN